MVVLNDETIKGMEKEILVGTPLHLDKKIRLTELKKFGL
jgi:hypothetical protein